MGKMGFLKSKPGKSPAKRSGRESGADARKATTQQRSAAFKHQGDHDVGKGHSSSMKRLERRLDKKGF